LFGVTTEDLSSRKKEKLPLLQLRKLEKNGMKKDLASTKWTSGQRQSRKNQLHVVRASCEKKKKNAATTL